MRVGAFVSETWGSGSDLDEVRQRARAVEAAGLASAWTPYLPWAIDALTAAHVAGLATSRIEVGTSVVPTYLWHPLALARQAGTIASDLDGRFVLGIGPSQPSVIETMHGIPYRRPARHTREVLAVLDAARAGTGRVDYRGELYSVAAMYANGPAANYPVLVGALGDRMLEVAGACADGTIVVIGDLSFVRTRLRAYADAGLTDVLAGPFLIGEDRAAQWQRTIDGLGEIAGDL